MTIVYLSGNSLTGSSGDTKPTLVSTNSSFLETDTLRTYNFNGTSWVLSGVGGSVSNAELDGSITLSKLATDPLARANHTGTLTVGSGGTGTTTLTANNIVLGNGTSAVTFVAPSTTGNVLTSDGTTWASSPVAPAVGATLGDIFVLG